MSAALYKMQSIYHLFNHVLGIPLCTTVAEIVKDIKEFQGLQALRLEGNTIGVEAAKAIAKALEDKSDFQVERNIYFTANLLEFF